MDATTPNAEGMRYGATPLLSVRRIDAGSEIPPQDGIDELFLVTFKMGDKDYTASLTREDVGRLVTDLFEAGGGVNGWGIEGIN